MKQLEELEKKVLLVVAANKALHEESALLRSENEQLKEKVSGLESSLLKESSSSASLSDERSMICDSIDELLESISSIQVEEKQDQ